MVFTLRKTEIFVNPRGRFFSFNEPLYVMDSSYVVDLQMLVGEGCSGQALADADLRLLTFAKSLRFVDGLMPTIFFRRTAFGCFFQDAEWWDDPRRMRAVFRQLATAYNADVRLE